MGNRPVAYWILVLIGVVAMVAAFSMRSSPDPHTLEMAKYLKYGGVAAIVVAILFFRGRPQATPPMPRD